MATLQGLPDLASLADLPGYLNRAGTQQIQDAQQFNQLGLQQNQASLQGTNLANMFAEQNNPQLLQKQAMDIEGLGYTNRQSKLKTENMEELNPMEKEARRAKLIAEASEDKLKEMSTTAQQWIMSGDPVKAQKGNAMLNASWGELVRRSEMQNKKDVTELQGQSRQQVATINQGGATTREGMGIEAGKYKKGTASKSLMDSYQAAAAKGPKAVAEAANMLADSFAEQGDAEQEAFYRARAQEARARAAEDTSNTGLSRPGLDTAAVAGLPASARPSATAPIGGAAVPGNQSMPIGAGFRGTDAQIKADIEKIPDPAVREQYRQQYEAQVQARSFAASAPKPAATKPPAKYSEIASMYPGVPEAKLREAFKKKFGVDLQ